jgi:uncharacterized membrane protein YqgA involved in biofilm formation
MTGTLLNAAGILLGGLLGLGLRKPLELRVQVALRGLLGVLTVYVGLRATWLSLGGGFWPVIKQLMVLVLALSLGRLLGRLLRIQQVMNRAGQYAKTKLAQTNPDSPARFADGFMTCTILFCVAPLALVGALQDGLLRQWQALGIKALMDGLAMMSFVRSFGPGCMLAAIPVISLQGTISLAARLLAPWLERVMVLDSINSVAGMLVFTVSLVILELKRVELGDYLPSLAVAPVLTWLWR